MGEAEYRSSVIIIRGEELLLPLGKHFQKQALEISIIKASLQSKTISKPKKAEKHI